MFDGHFCSLSLASTAGCHVLSKAPAMSSATKQHLVPRVLPLVTDSITFLYGVYCGSPSCESKLLRWD